MTIIAKSQDGRVRVVLDDDCNEGIDGDYREDREDIRLMRFDVQVRPLHRPNGWESLDDASYCTQIPADLPEKELTRLAKLILADVEEPARDHGNVKMLCERISWINPTWGTKDEKGGWVLDAMLEERRKK